MISSLRAKILELFSDTSTSCQVMVLYPSPCGSLFAVLTVLFVGMTFCTVPFRLANAAWVTSSENVVELSEEGGWVDTESGESATRLSLLRCLSSLTAVKIRGSYYHGHEYSFLREVTLSKGVKQDLSWVRNDPHIDEICQALKLNTVACEHYGVHLMKAIQKVNMNKLRSEYASQMRKRKEFDQKNDDRRRQIEEEMLAEQAATPQ